MLELRRLCCKGWPRPMPPPPAPPCLRVNLRSGGAETKPRGTCLAHPDTIVLPFQYSPYRFGIKYLLKILFWFLPCVPGNLLANYARELITLTMKVEDERSRIPLSSQLERTQEEGRSAWFAFKCWSSNFLAISQRVGFFSVKKIKIIALPQDLELAVQRYI